MVQPILGLKINLIHTIPSVLPSTNKYAAHLTDNGGHSGHKNLNKYKRKTDLGKWSVSQLAPRKLPLIERIFLRPNISFGSTPPLGSLCFQS